MHMRLALAALAAPLTLLAPMEVALNLEELPLKVEVQQVALVALLAAIYRQAAGFWVVLMP
jgi:hypothetical protein